MIAMLIVIKMGGSILKEGASSDLIADLKTVLENNQVILVHGGGVEVTEIASKLGKEQKFVISPEGFRSRYTDKETIEIYTMVMAGKMNKQIVLALQCQGISAVGLSGLDAKILQAERKKRILEVDERGRKRVIDGGYTGKINKVKTDILHFLLEKGYTPIVTPIAISEESEPLNEMVMNCNNCRSAPADSLILLTDVAGLMLKGERIEKSVQAKSKKSSKNRRRHEHQSPRRP